MLPCIKRLTTVVKSKGYEIGVGDEGLFVLSCKHCNEDSLRLITEDIVKGGYKLDERIYLGMDITSSILKRC